MLTQKEFLKINQAVKDAQNNDTPFLMMTEEGMAVAGDPNKIEKKHFDYKLRFRFPKNLFPKMENFTEESENFYYVEIDYPSVSVDPIIDHEVVKTIIELLPLIKKLMESGDVEEYTPEEEMELYRYVSTDAILALRNFVKMFLGVDDNMIRFLEVSSSVETFVKFAQEFPEVINESDSFLSGDVSREQEENAEQGDAEG